MPNTLNLKSRSSKVYIGDDAESPKTEMNVNAKKGSRTSVKKSMFNRVKNWVSNRASRISNRLSNNSTRKKKYEVAPSSKLSRKSSSNSFDNVSAMGVRKTKKHKNK